MRLKLKFLLENNRMPYEYRKAVLSFLKKCLEV